VSNAQQLTVGEDAGVWSLRGPRAADFALVSEFLANLADRNFSQRTGRAYAYDLLAFARWLLEIDVVLSDVDVDVMLRFLTACREATPQGRPGGNVRPMARIRLVRGKRHGRRSWLWRGASR
jgi:hypothetical protein